MPTHVPVHVECRGAVALAMAWPVLCLRALIALLSSQQDEEANQIHAAGEQSCQHKCSIQVLELVKFPLTVHFKN